jgi:hypothetical protein
MFDDYLPNYITPSPEQVLIILRDRYFQGSEAISNHAASFDLSMATTVDDWIFYANLLEWPQLAEAFNEEYGINEPRENWRQVMTPQRKRSMKDVCEFLAPRIRVPRVRVVQVAGKSCLSASVFLTVKSLLKNDGVSVEDIGPSTPLDAFTKVYYVAFFTKISSLICGGLPSCKVESMPPNRIARVLEMVWSCSVLAALGGPLVLVAMLLFKVSCAWPVGLVLIGLGHLGAQACAKWTPAQEVTSVTFSGLRTFRDLSEYIASQIKNQRMQCPAIR